MSCHGRKTDWGKQENDWHGEEEPRLRNTRYEGGWSRLAPNERSRNLNRTLRGINEALMNYLRNLRDSRNLYALNAIVDGLSSAWAAE